MSESEEIRHSDGRVELRDAEQLTSSPLYNHDLAPVAVAQRNWSTWDYAALWISMAHCIPTYTLASSMIAQGMAWWQALGTILVGNLIVLAPILLNSHPGTKYGIPFPVFARAAYGTSGANLPALMRALIACGWFGINAWIGGAAGRVDFAQHVDLLLVGKRVDRVDRRIQRARRGDRQRLADAGRARACDRTRRARGFEQRRQHDFVRVGETRLLARQRAHADTLFDRVRAILDDAVLERPRLTA